MNFSAFPYSVLLQEFKESVSLYYLHFLRFVLRLHCLNSDDLPEEGVQIIVRGAEERRKSVDDADGFEIEFCEVEVLLEGRLFLLYSQLVEDGAELFHPDQIAWLVLV